MATTATPGDNSWLIDMMITIMRAPTWNEPLQAFISEKCIMFDNFEEENKHEYVTVHNEFKSLVDNLLAAHLLEVDISPEEFERQLVESGLVEDPRLQQVVGQLMAAEDFTHFKQMMVERHTNMQQQAEYNYNQLAGQDMAADEAAAIAASIESAQAAQAAAAAGLGVPANPTAAANITAGAGVPTYAPPGSVPAPMPVAPTAAPTIQQERAFGAGGGFYGRASMPSAKAAPTKEKADAIRKALVGALRPR